MNYSIWKMEELGVCVLLAFNRSVMRDLGYQFNGVTNLVQPLTEHRLYL